uniref:CF0 subunit I of ATP synthase n=1 Tax=Nitella hyalina TaxID=181804 RepID=A0A2H4G701_NITHY|nr:CF0 subunit I of ATP synthase [Nitella hyalina]
MCKVVNLINAIGKSPIALEFGLNLDLFETNLINLGIVIGTLLYFGVYADQDSKRLEESKNITIRLEEQRAIEQIREQISKLALEKTLAILKTRLTSQLQTQMMNYNINFFLKDFKDPANR